MRAKTFTYESIIKESHLDTFGHMNNATYLILLEEARWEMLTENNYGLEHIMATRIGPTILDIKLRFLKELRLRDQITIETKAVSYEKKIGRVTQHILRGEAVCCTAELTIGLFDLTQRKLISPTPEWLKAIGIETETH